VTPGGEPRRGASVDFAPMRIATARAVAADWVATHGVSTPGFTGAFHHGSTNWLPADAELAPSSDVDVMVVVDDREPPLKPGKFLYRGVLLEVSLLPVDRVCSAETILADYHLAGSFRAPNIIADPTGRLRQVQVEVAAAYAQRRWVSARCESVRANVGRFAHSLNESDALHDQVTSWLFATGGLAHLVLVAGLQNPTVRRRYAAARELLAGYDMLDAYEALLAPLGCAEMSAARVEYHVAALEAAFDAASAAITTPFFFASDLSQLSRPIVIGGSRDLIAQGLHREAIFWICATYGRCLKVLHSDAPAGASAPHDASFAELLADLGVASYADRRERVATLKSAVARASAVAEALIAANPDIRG
jgi:hypothetical protein